MFWVTPIQLVGELCRSSLFFLLGKSVKWPFLFWTQFTTQRDKGFIQTNLGLVGNNELSKLCHGIGLDVILKNIRNYSELDQKLHYKYWCAAKCFRTGSPKITCWVLGKKRKKEKKGSQPGQSQVTNLRLLNEEYSHDPAFLSLVWFNSL